jgi:hypothetical protein
MIYSIATVRMHWRLLEIPPARSDGGPARISKSGILWLRVCKVRNPHPNSLEMTL